jgi:hypothetical protein
MKIPGYYTLVEAAEALGFTQRGAEKAALREEWTPTRVGNVNLYRAEDVHEYRNHRLRTRLVKKLGWAGRGLYRNDDIDTLCPECGSFAVEWPPGYMENLLCIKGHDNCYHYDGGITQLDDY